MLDTMNDHDDYDYDSNYYCLRAVVIVIVIAIARLMKRKLKILPYPSPSFSLFVTTESRITPKSNERNKEGDFLFIIIIYIVICNLLFCVAVQQFCEAKEIIHTNKVLKFVQRVCVFIW